MLNIPSKPSSHTQVFATTFHIVKNTFFHALPFFIGIILIAYALTPLGAWVDLSINNKDPGMIIVGLLCILVLIFFSYVFFGAAIYRMHSIAKAQDPGLGKTLVYGSKKAIPFFIVALLYAAAVILGGIFLVIPGIIIGIYWIFALYLIYFDSSIIDSFKESYRLVNNHWWRTAINMLLLTLAIFFIALLFIGITVIISIGLQAMLGTTSQAADQLLLRLFISLGAIIVMTFVYSFSIAFMLSCIYDLQSRRTLVPR